MRFYDGVNGGGQYFYRDHGQSVSRLQDVGMYCFLWSCSSTFYNRISSVETNGAVTALYSGNFFTGRSVEIFNEWVRLNLNYLDFDNIAGSLWVD